MANITSYSVTDFAISTIHNLNQQSNCDVGHKTITDTCTVQLDPNYYYTVCCNIIIRCA